MSDQSAVPPLPDQTGVLPLTEETARVRTLTAYADGVSSIAPTNGVIRMLFYQYVPHVTAEGPYRQEIVAQVVMSVPGFLNTAALFESAIEHFIAQNAFTREQWQAARAYIASRNP